MSFNFARSAQAAGLLAASMLWSTGARAQEADHVAVGLGVGVIPGYQGSDAYRVRPLPMIDVKQGPFFANRRNGVGVAVIDTDTVTIGTSVTYVPGYHRSDAPAGIDKVDAAAGARIFTTVHAGGFVFNVGATKAVSGSVKGLVADAVVAYPVTVSPRISLTPSLATTWADEKHNNGYFGVTAGESLASGLAPYSAGGGFKDVSASLTASYHLTDRITMSATTSVTTLLGDAKSSPIVFKRTQPSALLVTSYRF
uniref:MltA-interacting MipA family protein n=1 Tax=Caulobacter sp. (strain K31) TaxID=366602 RepID=B0T5I9_CAUSK